MKSIHKAPMPGVGATFVIAAVTAIAKPSPAVKKRKVQRKSHRAALQRKETQAKAGKAKLKADKASGRIAAQSEDSVTIVKGSKSIKGKKKDIAADQKKYR